MKRLSATLAATLAIATPLAAARRETPVATPAGEPVDCVQLSQIRQTQVRDDRTIDFFLYGKQVYRNTLPFSCPELGFEEGFSYRTSISQLCSIDVITVFRQGGGIHGATCGLGKFQPVTLAPVPAR